jgi:hypothetical protein
LRIPHQPPEKRAEPSHAIFGVLRSDRDQLDFQAALSMPAKLVLDEAKDPEAMNPAKVELGRGHARSLGGFREHVGSQALVSPLRGTAGRIERCRLDH